MNSKQSHNGYQLYIDGQWQPAQSGKALDVSSPATGETFTTIAAASAADVDTAVASAKKGLAVWRNTHPAERGRVLYRIAQELRARAQDFASLESDTTGESEQGNLYTVNYVAARRFEYYAGLADKILGDTFSVPGSFLAYTLREPIGVTAHIVPWNGPLWIGSRTIPPALAAGNAVVVKPSREAPLTLLKLAELAVECGLPPGVFNVITGESSEIGDALTQHPGVDAIYFTGSDMTGRRVLASASERAIHSVMELGGKSPNIVFADADIEAALRGAIWAIFANAGQICVAGSRLVVEKSIHAEFVRRLSEMARALRIGGPRDEADLGPLISAKQRERVLQYIAAGRGEGKLVAGGGVPTDPALQRGYYVQPTIFDEVAPAASIAQDEIFGPVLTVTPFSGVDEAIEIANHSRYGLASAIWTSNVRTAQIVAERLEAAQVYVNHYFSLSFEVSRTPYKGSGFGVSEGPHAIDEFLRTKTVTQSLQ